MTKQEILKEMQELEFAENTEANFWRYGELDDMLVKLHNEEKRELEEMTDLLGHINQGYEIIKQGKENCIAYSKTKNEFVSWGYSYNEDTGKPFFFWGRYGDLNWVTEQHKERESRC